MDYLKSYCDKFRLWAHIKLGSKVKSIKPLPTEEKWKHRITYVGEGGSDEHFDCSHVALCTGLHVQPEIPDIPGIENVKGKVFHSANYKFRSQLVNHDVLILGCGETAMGMSALRK